MILNKIKALPGFSITGCMLLMLASCKQINKSIDDTLHGRPRISKEDAFFNSDNADNVNKPNFLEDRQALARAEASLKDIPELKGKTIKVYNDMHMYDDGRIILQIQDPDTLQNVNEYDYGTESQWGAKQPVNTGSLTANDVKNGTIPLDSIPFVNVAKMAELYADSAKRYGSTTRLDHIYFVRDGNKWYCNSITGQRHNYEIYFKADGSVKEFNKQ